MENRCPNKQHGWLALLALGLLVSGPVVSQEVVIDEPYVDPYEGMWIPTGQPGSGLMIDQQDDTLVVTVFSYDDDGAPTWHLAAGPIENGVFEAEAFEYSGGSCLDCPWQAAETGNSVPIKLEIVAQTHAWLQWNEGERVPLRMLPFGVGNMVISFELTSHGRPAATEMPGRWLIVDERVDSPFAEDFLFDSMFFLDPGGFGWDATDFPGYFSCMVSEFFSDNDFANCELVDNRNSNDAIEDRELFTAYWGDLAPDHVILYRDGAVNSSESGVRGDDLAHGFRLTGPITRRPDGSAGEMPETATPTIYLEKGMWSVPGEPGSGVMFDVQDEILGFVVFSYDQSGDPVWYQGAGRIDAGFVHAEASRFTGGTCLNCEYRESHEAQDTVPVDFELVSKTTARMTFDGGETKSIRALPFDVPAFREFGEPGEFARPFLYDLRGNWVFISTEGKDRFFRRVTLTTPTASHGGDAVGWKTEDGTVMFLCLADPERFSSPQCRFLEHDGERWHRQFSAHWADVGEGQVIGYEEPPLSGDKGVTRGEELIYGFRLTGPGPAD